MSAATWALQIFLAVTFLLHGAAYLLSPEIIDRFQPQGRAPSTVPRRLRSFIGAAEVLGAIGLIGPALTHVLPWLTPLAAFCLAIVVALASIYHVRRGESPVATLVLVVVALTVAFLRWQVVPIS